MKATIFIGDAIERLRELSDESVQCVVTSPPYWGLRDYQTPGQLGMEKTPEEYIGRMVEVFREVRRVLRGDGTLWLNMGDSYARMQEGNVPQTKNKECQPPLMSGRVKNAGMKAKDLVGVPWMLAFALRADGWWLRQDIIWSKPNPMPESVTDRCTKAHEYLFLLTKSARYYFDQGAILEPCSPNTNPRLSQDLIHQIGSERAHAGGKTNGNMKAVGRKAATIGSGNKNNPSFTSAVCLPVTQRNKRSVWEIATQPFSEAHFATFPEKLVEPCILAGSSERGACPQCGAPWERIIEPTEEYDAFKAEERQRKGKGNGSGGAMRASNLEVLGLTRGTGNKSVSRQMETTGWRPSCIHTHIDTNPCTVLDPFCGSGTTGVVALRYHRNFVGIELNPEYAEMAERRIGGEIPLFAGVEVVRPKLAVVKAS